MPRPDVTLDVATTNKDFQGFIMTLMIMMMMMIIIII